MRHDLARVAGQAGGEKIALKISSIKCFGKHGLRSDLYETTPDERCGCCVDGVSFFCSNPGFLCDSEIPGQWFLGGAVF